VKGAGVPQHSQRRRVRFNTYALTLGYSQRADYALRVGQVGHGEGVQSGQCHCTLAGSRFRVTKSEVYSARNLLTTRTLWPIEQDIDICLLSFGYRAIGNAP
jgi:hypothetical protein